MERPYRLGHVIRDRAIPPLKNGIVQKLDRRAYQRMRGVVPTIDHSASDHDGHVGSVGADKRGLLKADHPIEIGFACKSELLE
jgi:hypothetical protein